MRLRNHCVECGAVIPWRKRAFYGNSYKPVICRDCSRAADIRIYGSLVAADAAMLKAIREEGLGL